MASKGWSIPRWKAVTLRVSRCVCRGERRERTLDVDKQPVADNTGMLLHLEHLLSDRLSRQIPMRQLLLQNMHLKAELFAIIELAI